MLEVLKRRQSNYTILIASCSWPIIALTETWLDSSVFNGELIDNNYTIFRKDRDFAAVNRSRGGGVYY